MDYAEPTVRESSNFQSNSMELTESLNSLHFQLSDGRQLEYYLFGDDSGSPVLYNHGMPGSAVEAATLDHVFKQHGLKVICPNRPGVGKSSASDNYCLEQITSDSLELLDHLECKTVSVIGWSSGGVPSLWQAKRAKHRVAQVILLSSYSHFSEFDQAPFHHAGQASWLKHLTLKTPVLSQWMFAITGYIANYLPKLYHQLMVKQCHTHDVDILDSNPAYRDVLLTAQRDTFTQSASSLFKDLVSQFQTWPFYLNSINCPVTIFQGDSDPFVPERVGQHLADCLPNAEYNLLSGQGHLYWLEKSFQYRLARLCQL